MGTQEHLSDLSSESWLGHHKDMAKKLAIVVGGVLCLAATFFFGQRWGYRQGLQEATDVAAVQATKSQNRLRASGVASGVFS